MKSKTAVLIVSLTIIIISSTLILRSYLHGSDQSGDLHNAGVFTNDSYISGLYTNTNLKDPVDVFRYVFSKIDEDVTVYPSEGYFYVKFGLRGKLLNCAIMLFPPERDSGIINFGYIVRVEDKLRQKWVPEYGGGKSLTDSDGVHIEKLNDFLYSITFEGKTVRFTLYNDGVQPPKKARLQKDEVFVGPSFDESGLRFFLIFNSTIKDLYWVLNEDGFVPEDFSSFSSDVVIGDRTGFAFYLDSANTRKILVAVDGFNMLQNNWYDGPFDQLPDNHVHAGQIEIKKYLDTAYRLGPEVLDKYGRFKHTTGSRIPVAPYRSYFDRNELRFVDTCRTLASSSSEFYAMITAQRFDVPEEYDY